VRFYWLFDELYGISIGFSRSFDIRSKDEIFLSNNWSSGFYLLDAESIGAGN
jgi:hypothetical protein